MTIYDIPTGELVKRAAEALKQVQTIKAPEWVPFVKTGVGKERPPVKEDWWFTRTASIFVKVARLGPVGVSKLRSQYSTRKNRGVVPERTTKGSGNILRKALQGLEKAGFVAQANKKGHKGRVVTPRGHAFLDKLTK